MLGASVDGGAGVSGRFVEGEVSAEALHAVRAINAAQTAVAIVVVHTCILAAYQ